MNEWIYVIVVNDNWQRRMPNTQKMTIITELATPRHAHCPSQQSAEDGTLGKHQYDLSNLSDIFARWGQTIRINRLNRGSAGTAGTTIILSTSIQVAQIPSPKSKDQDCVKHDSIYRPRPTDSRPRPRPRTNISGTVYCIDNEIMPRKQHLYEC